MSLMLFKQIDEVESINHRLTGQSVRNERQRRGITMTALAHACGWDISYMSLLETGRKDWNEQRLARVRVALNKVGRGK